MIDTIIIYQHKDPYDPYYEPEFRCPKCGSSDVFEIKIKGKRYETNHVCRDCWHKDYTDNFIKPE